jgi:uncharacterized protein
VTGQPGDPVRPPPPPPPPSAQPRTLRPIGASEREPILDALRGFALLGILLINVQLMRGPDVYLVIAGSPPPAGRVDQLTAAVLGLFVAGTFMSSFALLFGVGAAIIVGRSLARGVPVRPLLARRYAWLLALGLAHMVLLFPGDILFLYGLGGVALLAFLDVSPRVAAWWGVGLIAGMTVLVTGASSLGALVGELSSAGGDDALAGFVAGRVDATVAAFTSGSYLDVVVANIWQALVLQGSQLLLLPQVLGLFLLGYAVGRAGWIDDLGRHRSVLRRLAFGGIALGLPLKAGAALAGPLGIDGPRAAAATTDPLLAMLLGVAQLTGAPVLAVGYLSALTLLFLRTGAPRLLADLGRVALSGYLLQSLLALLVFAGFSLYGQLGTTSALVVVLGIWAVVLTAAHLWVRHVGQGPAERLWRRLTYGAAGRASPAGR